MKLHYHTLDVFTQTRFEGNSLAVVLDADALDAKTMQTIAREFNLPETVFVCSARDPINTARLRIFTPAVELPFAGHPTIGTAVLIASVRAPELIASQEIDVVLELAVGNARCSVGKARGKAARAHFQLPQLPERIDTPLDHKKLADALSLAESDIGFDAHVPSIYSAGTPFCFVPVSGLDAIARARPNLERITAAIGPARGAYLYTRETSSEHHAIHARMFGGSVGITEDPATGAAAAAFAGVAMAYEQPEDGAHLLVIEQGYEMGRPSLINLGMDVEGGLLVRVTLGGHAVLVSEGVLSL